GHRYWGLGCLWNTGHSYLGDGRILFCNDYEGYRYINLGQNFSYACTMLESGNRLILDDPNNWAQTPAFGGRPVMRTTAWYLTESGIPRSISCSSIAQASTFDGRPTNWPLLTDAYFQGGAGYSNTMPHDRIGIVMVATDGRISFLKNPWGKEKTLFSVGHPWD